MAVEIQLVAEIIVVIFGALIVWGMKENIYHQLFFGFSGCDVFMNRVAVFLNTHLGVLIVIKGFNS